MGRKKWQPPPMQEIEKLAELCLTEQQICDCLGICADTYYKRKREYAEFSEVVKRGRAKRVKRVAKRVCREAAKADGDIAAAIFFLRSQAGWNERRDLTVRTDEPIKVTVRIVNSPRTGDGGV